jgi:ubiquinone/menaquinone biosynthesis C-methylase UbiE
MRRVVQPELLDSDAGTQDEVAASLADLRWLNRYFGGHATTAELLSRVAGSAGLERMSFLDVAGASGDNAHAARVALIRKAVEVETAVADLNVTHLSSGVCADAFHLPFRDAAFDVCGSALFLHHLEEQQIVALTQEMLRVARVAVLVNDLCRSRIHWLTAMAGTLVYRSRLTRHDAPVSVRRAYTQEELLEVLKRAGGVRIEASEHYFYRMGFILWK